MRQEREPFPRDNSSLQIAKLKREGVRLEVVVNADKAFVWRRKSDEPFEEVLAVEGVFSNARKGMRASAEEMKKATGFEDAEQAAREVVRLGDIPKPSSMLAEEREQKRVQLVSLIHRNAVDPVTHRPHPMQRIENAFAEAKVQVDDRRQVLEQLDDVMKKLRPILPLRFETKEVAVRIPALYAAKAYGLVAKFSRLLREDWQNDGSLVAVVEMPGGLEEEFHRKVNALTHGEAETKVLKTK